MRIYHAPVIVIVALLIAAEPSAASSSSTSTGISREFNPAISVNSLLLYSSGALEVDSQETGAGSKHEHEETRAAGFTVQESELQLSANVDAYLKATLTFAMHGTSAFEMEEGYLNVLGLPAGLGFKLGQFSWEFGKHNSLHTHQYPFVERPQAWDELLGEHGLSGVAVELGWLSPLPWYAEAIVGAFPLTSGIYGEDREIPENTWGQSARLRQLFETGDRSTLDFGASWLAGSVAHDHGDGIEEGDRVYLGADLTWKWIGPGSNPRQIEIQGEWLRRSDSMPDEESVHDGWYLSARVKLSRRVWAGARYDAFNPQEEEAELEEVEEHVHEEASKTAAVSLVFVPSEFQAWRVDLLQRKIGDETIEGLRLQANFTIGSHPAHRY